MQDDLDALSSRALKGDVDAIGSILSLAEKQLATGDHVNAAKLFRDAAIFYRIDASRQSGAKEEAESRLEFARSETEVLKRFLARSNGAAPAQRHVEGLDDEAVREIVVDYLYFGDDDFMAVFQVLQARLMELGAYIGSPGSSVQRYAWGLASYMFGIGNISSDRMAWLSDPIVSSAMTLIADEVERRVGPAKPT